MNIENNSIKAPMFAALALAFASFGDAFLYPFLPLNSGAAGIPVTWVGLLLSVNRFVRIISNTLLVHAFSKYGLRSIMILAVALAITSTFGYSFASGLFAWLSLRIIWGLAFSAMRIGTLGYALGDTRIGFSLGVSRAVQEAGPMVALVLAPFLVQYFEFRTIFYILTLMSLPALYFAFNLPAEHDQISASPRKILLRWPSSVNAVTFFSAMVIDGMLIIVLGILFLRNGDAISVTAATALAAFYLVYKRICLVTLSPIGGWIADKIGLGRVFTISFAFVVMGLVVILSGWSEVGTGIVFMFYSINSALTPGSTIRGSTCSLGAVAENATWRDIGAAVGTLAGGMLISSPHLKAILAIAIFVLAVMVCIRIVSSHQLSKYFSYGSSGHL